MPHTGSAKTAFAQTTVSEIATWDCNVPRLGLIPRGVSRSWIAQCQRDSLSRKRTLGPSDKIGRNAARRLAKVADVGLPALPTRWLRSAFGISRATRQLEAGEEGLRAL